jgi:hypothetical protein
MGRRKKSQPRGTGDGLSDRPIAEISELLASATESVEAAIMALVRAGPPREGRSICEPCGPKLDAVGSDTTTVDRVLTDRYEGLLVRAGVVAGAVHIVPSRLRERLEDAFRELIAGVARDGTIEASRIEGMVDDLIVSAGQQVVAGVERWRREQSLDGHVAAPLDEARDGTEVAARHQSAQGPWPRPEKVGKVGRSRS